jgi:hypothetical protein
MAPSPRDTKETLMHRISVRHEDADHPHGATFAWRRTFDSADEARAALPEAAAEFPPESGYALVVEYLFTDGKGDGSWKEID